MGRIVLLQPNGLFGLFSSVVDDMVWFHLTPEGLFLVRVCEDGGGALNDFDKLLARVREDGLGRYEDVLATIQAVHGKHRAQKRAKQMSAKFEDVTNTAKPVYDALVAWWAAVNTEDDDE